MKEGRLEASHRRETRRSGEGEESKTEVGSGEPSNTGEETRGTGEADTAHTFK